MKFKPLNFEIGWFDSLGAKSASVLIETPDVKVFIDPGIAVMHPSFPAPVEVKFELYEKGYERIVELAKKADVIIITHYHYDHFTDFDPQIYRGKLVFAKNPNEYINNSQRKRAINFYENLYGQLGEVKLEEVMLEPEEKDYPSPLSDLEIARSKSFGDYDERRRQLLMKGEEAFRKLTEKWCSWRRVPEADAKNIKLRFADGRKIEFGNTTIKFTKPLFHGIEYSKLGWTYSVVIEHEGIKLMHTSDLNGPIIEDYADLIINENPDILFLDGPPTYLLGYTMNLTNFKRAVENAIKIIENTRNLKLIIYDHHLPREPKFRERTKKVWEIGEKIEVEIVTAAEYLGEKPAVLRFSKPKNH
ncbi:MAG: MBL fold metallo-hydrolase [archaeon GB-1867-005]|nr:MBL fold metallo-hydrolase [Candidatus Culexmicrobium cathedralense]